MNRRLSGSEEIPGSGNRTAQGPISFEWFRRNKAGEDYSRISGCMGNNRRSLQAHAEHCQRHPNDHRAKLRKALLAAGIHELEVTLQRPRSQFRLADFQYRRKMIELAEIPLEYRHDAEVTIIDFSGSARIFFGPISREGQWPGCWVLYANGTLHRERTP